MIIFFSGPAFTYPPHSSWPLKKLFLRLLLVINIFFYSFRQEIWKKSLVYEEILILMFRPETFFHNTDLYLILISRSTTLLIYQAKREPAPGDFNPNSIGVKYSKWPSLCLTSSLAKSIFKKIDNLIETLGLCHD